MSVFEVGKKYWDTSACDHNCVFTPGTVMVPGVLFTFCIC